MGQSPRLVLKKHTLNLLTSAQKQPMQTDPISFHLLCSGLKYLNQEIHTSTAINSVVS